MVGILGHHHLGQQPGCRDAFVDDLRGHRRLNQGFTLGADPLAPDVALDREHAWLVVQLLGHVLADAFHPASTAAGGGFGFVMNLAARQVGRQRLAPGLLFLTRRGRGRGELLNLVADRLQVGVQRLVEQASLLGAVALGLRGELQPLEQRVLVSELVDEGLLVPDLSALPGDLLVFSCRCPEQRLDHLAQLVCAEF